MTIMQLRNCSPKYSKAIEDIRISLLTVKCNLLFRLFDQD